MSTRTIIRDSRRRGEILKRLLKKHHLSYESAAELFINSSRTVARWCQEGFDSVDCMIWIADCLKEDVGVFLISDEEDPSPFIILKYLFA